MKWLDSVFNSPSATVWFGFLIVTVALGAGFIGEAWVMRKR